MTGPPPRTPIVDRVLDSYRQLRSGNRRLSALDRQRLDDHLSRLAELQRRLHVTTSASCGSVPRPTEDTQRVGYAYTDPVKARRRAQLNNDVIVAAFMCGTTRIAVHGISETFAAFSGDWHQDIAHKSQMAGPQQILADALRDTFQASVLDLAAKLDVEEAGGATYLDNTLIAWTQESGQHTHDSPSIPVITFGSAGGFFKTGMFVDYRNLTPAGRLVYYGQSYEWVGLTYNRWLGTVLQAMGLARSEYERDGIPGYGLALVAPEYAKAYAPGAVASASDVLPVIT